MAAGPACAPPGKSAFFTVADLLKGQTPVTRKQKSNVHLAGTGKAPHVAANKVARRTAENRGERVCEGHSFPGNKNSNGLSIKGTKHSTSLELSSRSARI